MVGEDEETESEEEDFVAVQSETSQRSDSTPNSQTHPGSSKKADVNGFAEKDRRSTDNEMRSADTGKVRKERSSAGKGSNIKQRIIQIVPSKRAKPQLKEVKSRSRMDQMRSGLGNMLKSGKKMVEKNFNAPTRGKWEHAIHEATATFHDKTVKAVSCNLSAMQKQTERCKSECEQCINHLHDARVNIQKANQNLESFCDDDKY